MRLVNLNIWLGNIFDPLVAFIREQAPETDIFCFQEMATKSFNETVLDERQDIYLAFQKLLPEFQSHLVAIQDFPYSSREKAISYGLAIFVRKSICVEKFGSFFCYGERNQFFVPNPASAMPSAVQYAILSYGGKRYVVANFHGLSVWPKADTPARLEQSRVITDFFKEVNCSKILCGDFNLLPETKSLALLENGMLNLVKEFKIPLTRSQLLEGSGDKISDYILVSPDIVIEKFLVPNIAISDHLPLILNFH